MIAPLDGRRVFSPEAMRFPEASGYAFALAVHVAGGPLGVGDFSTLNRYSTECELSGPPDIALPAITLSELFPR